MKRRSDIVIDLGYGDAGKGTVVDYLAHQSDAPLIVRFNGGPQAGHNVVTPDGRHHTFAQFGSGMFNPNARTLLSRFMLIEPYAMFREADHLESIGVAYVFRRTMIDERCIVITPIQQAANRLRERHRGASAHGTCGLGFGETVSDSIERKVDLLRAGDLQQPEIVRSKLQELIAHKQKELAELARSIPESPDHHVIYSPNWIDAAIHNYELLAKSAEILPADQSEIQLAASSHLIFEGAQGVLLDETFGFHPHTTWSTTTAANAHTLLNDARIVERPRVLGVIRCYATRHGAGPFVSEIKSLELPEPHNLDCGAQGRFRRGALDFVALKYAIACTTVDELAVTHLDLITRIPTHACTDYEWNETSHDRSRFFEMNSDRVAHAIKAQRRSLDEQEKLTKHLFESRPVFGTQFPNDPKEIVQLIAAECGRPVSLISRGATRHDKVECNSIE
ncbi:MAG TPA: adenylosuccinate synthetase [Tepidisphaeraceae bacterium]|nr:adenylosuccinate synthetase [Tepidisphaeraceae bacterium]